MEKNEMILELRRMNSRLGRQLCHQRLRTLIILMLAGGAVFLCLELKDEVEQYRTCMKVIAENMEKMDLASLNRSMSTLETKVNELDVDSLNQSIQLLEEKIGDLDMAVLNQAMISMQEAADSVNEASESMEKVSEWFKGVFKIE
ncbi:MAG: hypothetical protein ACI4C1_06275 [Lachnospiraceae bacterium]